jgi:isopenicillin-N epimerase
MASPLRSQFLLRKDITYLNFGSFGACPAPVFKAYQQFQRTLEEEPAQFFSSTGPALLRTSREALGTYINCEAADVVYVPNPSYAVNIVAKSFKLEQGDEVLTTDLEYGACERTWAFYCGKAGATLQKQHIPLPLTSAAEVVEALFSGVNQRTKLIFVSHITSSTALILPVKEIALRARKLGIACYIDGAHAPGQVPVDLRDLDVDFYTGACHKWMLAPKGCAFLYTKKSRQSSLDPLVVSWGYDSATPSSSLYLDYHEGQGTRDYSAFCTVPACIEFMQHHKWHDVAASCRKMVHESAAAFCELLQCKPLAPLTDDFVGQMLSLPLRTQKAEELQSTLFRDYKIEIPVMRHGQQVYLRYSLNAFNSTEDLNRLHDALTEIIAKTTILKP